MDPEGVRIASWFRFEMMVEGAGESGTLEAPLQRSEGSSFGFYEEKTIPNGPMPVRGAEA